MSQTIEAICTLLTDDDPKVRSCAAEQLATLGEDARPAAVLLTRVASDADERVREWTIATLEGIGSPSVEDCGRLAALLVPSTLVETPMPRMQMCAWLLLGCMVLSVSPVLARDADEQTEEDGFVPLFDGNSLDGWQGATDGYKVEDGIVVCTKKGGQLYTNDEFADFHLKFEFKLTPGANNGIGIRTTLNGNPAYAGMEIQVLDDTAPKYKNLKLYQYHGSIYGVVPAKRGHLRSVGEWNEEEIICVGSHVTVKLNGETIVDADIIKASTPKTLDGKNHPGLKRDKGRIAFCGHGARVAFRNMRIRVLVDKE